MRVLDRVTEGQVPLERYRYPKESEPSAKSAGEHAGTGDRFPIQCREIATWR